MGAIADGDRSAEVFSRDGVVIFEKVFGAAILDRFAAGFSGEAGRRHTRQSADVMRDVAEDPTLHALIDRLTLTPHRLVRAIAFDKSPARNWFVPWHQDRSIAVATRAEVAGYAAWTVKDGLLHVEPPDSVLAGMVTLRVHLDDCDESNGPLEVIPGTHRIGKLSRPDIARIVETGATKLCLADRGDVVAMRPLLVHRSQRAAVPSRRRVLHLEFATGPLPAPLAWSLGLFPAAGSA